MKTRTKRYLERKINEESGEVEWIPKEVIKTTLDETDRIKLVGEILNGETTAENVRRAYDIVSVNTVYTWIGRYLSQVKSVSLHEEAEEEMARKSKEEQIKELKAQLKQKEKELELEKLRAHAYDKMIDVAEEMFNIPIRKKAGTKQ